MQPSRPLLKQLCVVLLCLLCPLVKGDSQQSPQMIQVTIHAAGRDVLRVAIKKNATVGELKAYLIGLGYTGISKLWCRAYCSEGNELQDHELCEPLEGQRVYLCSAPLRHKEFLETVALGGDSYKGIPPLPDSSLQPPLPASEETSELSSTPASEEEKGFYSGDSALSQESQTFSSLSPYKSSSEDDELQSFEERYKRTLVTRGAGAPLQSLELESQQWIVDYINSYWGVLGACSIVALIIVVLHLNKSIQKLSTQRHKRVRKWWGAFNS